MKTKQFISLRKHLFVFFFLINLPEKKFLSITRKVFVEHLFLHTYTFNFSFINKGLNFIFLFVFMISQLVHFNHFRFIPLIYLLSVSLPLLLLFNVCQDAT